MSDYNAADKFTQPADGIIIVSRAAVKANIQALADLLSGASARAAEAAANDDQNGAIGTLAGIEQDLESALALYRAALVLHRGARS